MEGVPRYGDYKDSGIPWLGKIPSHWHLRKSKYLWREVEDRSESGNEQLLSVSQYSGITPRDKDSRSESLVDYKQCKPNDLIVNIMLAWLGALGISQHEGIVSPAYCVYRQTADHYSKFLGYLYCTPIYLAEFARRSKGVVPSRWRMYTEDFDQILTLLPPLSEQQRIATFLDQKTTEIDAAINKKQRLIELLQEQKAILINQAVTKGLNPNVPMHNCGVEWIGEIPEHWETGKIKHIVKLFGGGTPNKDKTDFWDGDIPWVSPKDMKQRYLSNITDRITQKALKKTTLKLLAPASVLIVVRGMILARKIPVALSSFPLTINQDMKAMIPNKRCYPEYLLLLIEGINAQLAVLLEESGHGTKTLPTEKLGNFVIPIPPKAEQEKIISKIKENESHIDTFTKSINCQIEQLKELKQIVISNTVTGKIKV